MYEAFNYDYFMQTMLANVPDDLDKREGSVIWDALAPAALELETVYMFLVWLLNQSFGDTADREYLILRAHERGLSPYPATSAVLKGVFVPSDTIVAGKRFNIGELNYVVGDPVTGEPGAYQMICETTGTIGHKTLGLMTPIDYVDGLQSASATDILIPGEDEEETEHFRERYFNSFNNRAYGGNIQDYLEKTNSISGVGSTKVIPIWNGGGTVKLIILDSNYDKATSTLIETVQETIDPSPQGTGVGVAPIGHTVTVVTATEVNINIKTTLEYGSGYSWELLKDTIEETLEEYYFSLRKDWANNTATVVRISQIETRLLAIDGIVDISDTTINNVAANLTLLNNQIPVMGSVAENE